jgi:tetratricopeptide (TPR) repeat protein
VQSESGGWKRRAVVVAAILVVSVLAGGLRALYLEGFQNSPFAETPFGKSAADVSTAKAISTTGSLNEGPLEEPPLYPLLLSLTVSSTGDEKELARRAQAVGAAITACLIVIGGTLFIGTGGGLLAGVLFALYGPSMYWDAQVVPAAALLFVFACYWLSAAGAWRSRSIPLWLLAGLFLGTMAGMKTGAFVLIAPALVLILSRARSDGRARSVAAILLLVAGTAIAVAPFAIHNARAGALGVPVATDGGVEFYKANNPDASGLPPSYAGEETWWLGSRYAAAVASANSGRVLSPGEVSRYWFKEAASYIARRPLSYIGLVIRKLGHFWSARELTGGPSPGFVSRRWVPWSAPLMHAFAVLGSLTLAGAFLLRKKPYALAVAFPLIGALALGLVYTSDSATRLLAVPSLAVISGAFVFELAGAIRSRRFKYLLACAGALALAGVVVNLAAPQVSRVRPLEANDERLLGAVYEAQGKGSIALDLYDKAAKAAPKSAACRLSLAAMLASDGVAGEAEKQFLTAAALDTLNPMPYVGLANLYRKNGLYEQSLRSLQSALERAPFDPGLRISLGRSCVDMGLYELAEKYFREVLETDPENVAAIDGLLELRDRGVNLEVREREAGRPSTVREKIRLAMSLLRQGEMDSSRVLLDEAALSEPENLDIVFASATWYLTAGDYEKAIEGYEKCLAKNPKNVIVMNNLAAAYHDAGRVDQALDMWRRILTIDPTNAKAKSNIQTVESERAGSAQ